MVSLLRHLGEYRGDAPFGAWVRQVAVRQCLMHLRSPWQRARRLLASPGNAGTGDEPATEAQLADRIDLERALAGLPGTARAIVWMHDVEGLTHDEIAGVFGRTTSFSKSQLARAHALLREHLEGPSRASRPQAGARIAAQGQVP
jgi:RNA polymerase sigma-70 factor (ECF subfamily)